MLKSDKQYDELISIPKQEYENLRFENEMIKGQLAELRRMIFGRKSEKISKVNCNQPSLFGDNYVEEPESKTINVEYTKKIKQKKIKRPVRVGLPAYLERKEEVVEPEGITENHKQIGQEITEILEMISAKMYVRRIIRPKYIDPKTEEITIAQLPSLPIPKGNAGASVLSHIMVSKFIDHLPLYRQLQIFKRHKVALSKSTIGGWFTKTTALLSPLYGALKKSVLSNTNYLQADESPIKVQDKDKKGSLHQGYMWVVRDPISGLVLFKYNKGRGRNVPESLFENFNGTLQTDGYKVYQNLNTKGQISLLGCMAHARRYFEKAKDNDYSRAKYVLGKIQLLYAIERKAKEREINHVTLTRYRKLYALPVLIELKIWLKEHQIKVMPKSAIAKAINYTLTIYTNLSRYIEDGKFEIDNNMIENSIRPLALGRKNYLFAGNHEAAQGYAIMYSLFATCKTNNINPLDWLTDVLNRIQDHKVNRLDEMLPNNWHPNNG